MSSSASAASAAAADPILVIDRVVTATSANALIQALLGLKEAIREGMELSPTTSDSIEEELWKALTLVLNGRHKAMTNMTQRDEAWQAVLHLYKQLAGGNRNSSSSNDNNNSITRSKAAAYYNTWLADPAWMPALVDIAAPSLATENNDQDASVVMIGTSASYTRVLALQTIVRACQVANAKIAQQALLETPQALTRLAELVIGNDTEEQLATLALQELAPLIGAWPAAAKVWVFSEVPERLLRQMEPWTGGNAVTADALRLITQLLSHDAMSVLLMTQSAPDWGPLLTRLLDLRQGQQYLDPDKIPSDDRKKHSTTINNAAATTDVDDLDDLLQKGNTTTKNKSSSQDDDDKTNRDDTITTTPSIPVPRLLPAEEDILRLVLELLRTLLQHPQVQKQVWQQEKRLVAMCWDWACMGPPVPMQHQQPDQAPSYPCAFSSIELQVQVLELVAEYFNDSTLLLDHPQWHGMDRLLYLVCTGGPGTTEVEQLQISQAAVAVLRRCLDGTVLAPQCVLAALAPPLLEQEQEEGEAAPHDSSSSTGDAAKAIVLPKLLQTVVEHIQQPPPTLSSSSSSSDNDRNSSSVGLIGSLSALALFQGDTEASKSLLLKFTTSSLLHDSWERLALELEQQQQHFKTGNSGTSEESVEATLRSQRIIVALLRWVGSWMTDAPLVTQAWLQDAESSAILGHLVKASSDDDGKITNHTTVVPTLASLVLGVALVNLPANQQDCGGWTKGTIVDVLQRGTSLPKRISQWEALRKSGTAHESILPWIQNSTERQAWGTWYTTALHQVRRAWIHHVTGGDDPNDDDDNDNAGGPSRKSLQAIVKQQAEEMERLRKELQSSQNTVKVQEKHLAAWKQRVESTPTALDQMLSDYGAQTAALEETIETLRADLADRNSKIEVLENQVKDLRTVEQEVTEERDRIQDEMQALSDAYSSLEEEYRRQEHQHENTTHGHPTTAAGEDPSGVEDAATNRPAEQSQGENPDQLASSVGSTEVATLRAENSRLRETARSADEWMKMAVERMSVQDAQLAQTQQRIAELEAQLGGTDITHDERLVSELRQALESERMDRGQVEQELSGLRQENMAKEQQAEAHKQELEKARHEVVVLRQEVSLIQSQNNEMLREDSKTFDALVTEGKAPQNAAGAEVESARERVAVLLSEKNVLEGRVLEMEAKLTTSQDTTETVESLRNELVQSRAEKEAQMAQKDEELRLKEDEITKLQEANQEAQEWMQQAVEHHNTLSQTNVELLAENEALREQFPPPAKSDSSSEHLQSKIESLSRSLEELQGQVQSKEERINALVLEHDATVAKLNVALSELSSERDNQKLVISKSESIDNNRDLTGAPSITSPPDAEIAALRKENERLKQEKAQNQRRVEEAELEYEQMKSELAVLTHEYEDIQVELDSLKQENPLSGPLNDEKIEELEHRISALEEERNQLQEESTRLIDDWRIRYTTLEAQQRGMEAQLKSTQSVEQSAVILELKATIDELRQEIADQDTEAQSAVSQWMASYDELKEEYCKLESKVKSSSIDTPNQDREKNSEEAIVSSGEAKGIAKLKNEVEVLKEQLETERADADAVVAQWQASHDELKNRVNTLQGDNDELQHEIEPLKQQLETEKADADAAVAQWESSFLDLQKQYDTLRIEHDNIKTNAAALEVCELQKEVAALKRQLQEDSVQSKNEILTWQASYNRLQEQYDELRSHKDTAVAIGEDKARTGLETEVKNLKKQLAEVSAEAENAIEEWQSSYNDLQEQYEALKKQDSLVPNGVENDYLQAEIDALKKQVQDEREDADNIIGQWKTSYDALQKENEALIGQARHITGTTSADDTALRNEIESLRKQLQEEKDEANNIIFQWEASFNDLKEQLDVAQNGSDDLAVLKADIESLHARLQQESSEAEAAIAQWEEGYIALETENQELRQKLQSSSSESAGGDMSDLEKEISGLRHQLEDSRSEKEVWENKYRVLESEMEIQKSEYETFAKSFEEAGSPTTGGHEDFKSVIAELEAEISTLKERIRTDNHEANEAVSQWEESYEILQTENQELQATNSALEKKAAALLSEKDDLAEIMSQLKSEKALNVDEISRLSEEVHTLQETIDVTVKNSTELTAKVETLQSDYSSLLSVRDGLEAKLNELTESHSGNDVPGLQSKIDALEDQLAEQAKEAEDAVSQWQESYNDLEESLFSVEAQLESAREREITLQSEIERLKEEYKFSLDELTTGKAEIQALQESHSKLQSLYDEVVRERDEFRVSDNSSRIAELTEEVKNLHEKIQIKSDEYGDEVRQWSESHQMLQEDYNGVLDELKSSKSEINLLRAEIERLQNSLSNESEDLRAELAQLQQQRDNEVREAEDAIDQWQTSYNDLQQDFETLQKERDEVIDRSNKLDEENKNLLIQLKFKEDEVAEDLDKMREELSLVQTQRNEDALKAEESIKQWQESYEEIEADLLNARAEIESASTIKEEWETHMAALQGRLSELEAAMEQTVGSNERLQVQLDDMTSRGKDAEATFQQRRVEYETALADKQAVIDRLEGDLVQTMRNQASYETENHLASDNDRAVKLQEEHKSLTIEMDALRKMFESIQVELDEEKRIRVQRDHELDESEAIINSWKARVDELETLEQELRDELERTQQEAEEAITIWEEQCHDLEKQLREGIDNSRLESELTNAKEEISRLSKLLSPSPEVSSSDEASGIQLELGKEKEARKLAHERAVELEEKLKSTEEMFTARIESIHADHARAKQSEDAHRLHERERMNDLEQKNEDIRRQKVAAEAEVDRLKVQLSEQDNEIRELYSSLQLHQTNEISSRAAKFAAQELRKQVDMLERKLEEDTKAVEAERTSRLAAEQESKRVRADLAALLGVENTEENLSEIRQRTMEATEHFQRKEQGEIEDLRGSLNKALSELEKARHEAMQSEDRAFRAELDFSTVEEDLLTARSELKYMTLARDELQDAETSRRASLEARIAALESDHISLRRFHASEMERLRSELNQVSSERDRLLQSVRNAESSKDSVLGSLTNETPAEDLVSELHRLRLEKAALLSQSSEEAARTERRIREARSADRSASQTQVVVERELRLAAERALAVATEDIAKAKQAGCAQDPNSKTRIDELTRDLEASFAKNEKLSSQLAEIRRELEELRRKSRHEKEQLQEECRQAKHRVTQLEQKGRFEAEVRAEVARIQSSPSRGKSEDDVESKALAEVQPSSENSNEQATVVRLYDIIESLRQQMDEERKVHFEDREEMEDLLKLVVQQKLSIDSLTAALQAIAGDGAVEEALEDAQARTEAQYGRPIQ